MNAHSKILVSTLCALLLAACEKPSDEVARAKVSPEANGNPESFPALPLLWQSKGGIAEATTPG